MSLPLDTSSAVLLQKRLECLDQAAVMLSQPPLCQLLVYLSLCCNHVYVCLSHLDCCQLTLPAAKQPFKSGRHQHGTVKCRQELPGIQDAIMCQHCATIVKWDVPAHLLPWAITKLMRG
jgi:hypothetical protein